MLSFVNLKKTGAGWEFESEEALEDFVWANLTQMFGLIPLKRQHTVKGQFCDILALGDNKQLVVLELKNVEDRYIVQQLTRYYDALREEKPFSEQVDYERAIGLTAIAPTFHRDNFTDRKYNHLNIQCLKFVILADKEKFYLQLKDVDTENISQLEIPHQQRESNNNIPAPSRLLRNILAKCTAEQQEGILRFRQKILNFDRRMKEISESGFIKYARGKTKPFAELRFDSERNSPALFLWLPFATYLNKKIFTARMRVWTDWEIVSDVGYVRKGFGRVITKNEWQFGYLRPLAEVLPRTKHYRESVIKDETVREKYITSIRKHSTLYWSGLAMPITDYYELMGEINKLIFLDSLVDVALKNWLAKL